MYTKHTYYSKLTDTTNLINNSTTESRKNFNNTMESDIVINDPSVDSLNSIDKSTFCLTTINKTKLGDIFLNELSSNNGSSIFYFYSLSLVILDFTSAYFSGPPYAQAKYQIQVP